MVYAYLSTYPCMYRYVCIRIYFLYMFIYIHLHLCMNREIFMYPCCVRVCVRVHKRTHICECSGAPCASQRQ